ncbi:hypothetical protein AJ88_07005 [Mesorhizobium amorphae CCBAU 01583]|nr:hypothetical protein AJ88_07005 [Mesorhizobium amorphae CCBAU 01583]
MIGRLEIDPFKVVDSFLETTLAKCSQPSLVVPMVIAAWVDTVGRVEILAGLVRPAIEIQGFCQPDIVQGIARVERHCLEHNRDCLVGPVLANQQTGDELIVGGRRMLGRLPQVLVDVVQRTDVRND